MNISAMLKTFCDAVERRDGNAFADLFTEDGVYHDVFYGAFKGRAKIGADRRLVLFDRDRFPLGHASASERW
jgi:ketosteroid isomerase-like protein